MHAQPLLNEFTGNAILSPTSLHFPPLENSFAPFDKLFRLAFANFIALNGLAMSQVKFTDGECSSGRPAMPFAVTAAGEMLRIRSESIFNELDSLMFCLCLLTTPLDLRRREGIVLPWAVDLRGKAAEDAR